VDRMITGAADSKISGRGSKGREAFRTISEVADQLDLPQHVLRFWESKFAQIKPLKRGGNRRYYRPDDVKLLTAIKKLLHADGYTIRGVQKLFKAQGLKATIVLALDEGGAADLAASMNAVGSVAAADPVSTGRVLGTSTDEQATSRVPQVTEQKLRVILNKLQAIRARLD
jgi:DNA-binding transcriptional MerR regulator